MARILLDRVTKRFGAVEAVKELSLDIRDGEFFCILGPPGAGKTTTLRLIVGLERPDEGGVFIDGESMRGVHPGRRDIAIVFQNLALYPDKTVFENIAFPLRERRVPEAEIQQRVRQVADLLGIARHLDRRPAQLSGGERQRVAIGRAIVRQPRAYLLDEPLSNLDALLRLQMRVELKRLQQDLGKTMVYVTHDQIEAMSMADRIAVYRQGRLQQCDVPDVVYNRPANRYVATVVGSPPMNFLPCALVENGSVRLRHEVFAVEAREEVDRLRQRVAEGARDPGKLLLGVRPEDVAVLPEAPPQGGVPATVLVTEPLGAEVVVDLRVGADLVKAVAPPTLRVTPGQPVWLRFNLARAHVFDAESERNLFTPSTGDTLAPV